MDMFQIITELTTTPGVSGNEDQVAEVIKKWFRNWTDDVWSDVMNNTYARFGNPDGPTILLMAHMDEIGLMVADIEDNGMIRLYNVAGVDPRVLPGSEVQINGKEPVPAVVGALPPHLQKNGDNTKNYAVEDLLCDTGLSAEEVKELVRIGDTVSFRAFPPMKLKNGAIAGKTFDDRACVVALMEVMELLKNYKLDCNVVVCASIQEENGLKGGLTGAYHIDPDMAIAIDVCHAPQPGAKPVDYTDFDKVAIARGGNIHPKMFEQLKASAKEQNIDYDVDVMFARTGTDAWTIQTQRGGIPTGLISLPLRYMHTSVEVISMETLKNCAKVIAGAVKNIGADWEETLCLDD
ncbi:MAG: M20/M25/M40 family metallo-hydrolase [Firmicutes bacterium]|nr:M20/M25/M40 family metallo-hydrolase [Bacillota bacterium]